MDDVYRLRVRTLMRQPVPVPKTPAFDVWQADIRALGADCVDTLLEALETGEDPEQYAALLSLRLHGYEAWADGYWHDIVYEVRAPGATEVRVIKPRITVGPP